MHTFSRRQFGAVLSRALCSLSLVVVATLAGCNAAPSSTGTTGGASPSAKTASTGTGAADVGSGSASATPAKTGPLRIAMIPKGTTHEFWKSVHAGADKAAKEFGDVTVLWKGPILENDREGQIQVVQDFIVQQVDGICLAPLDSAALVPYVQQAVDASIPVAVFDSGLDQSEAIVSYVASDNRKGGEIAAHRMAEVLGGSGQVIVLRYNPGSESTYQREEGFLETLKTNYPGVTVLSSDQYAGTTPESALAMAGQVLQQYRDQVTGIFAVCEPNATGVLRALEEHGLQGKVKFVAFDPAPELIAGLSSGSVHGIVLQDPVNMGYESIRAIVRRLRGETVEPRIGTGEYVATNENQNEEPIRTLLHPATSAE